MKYMGSKNRIAKFILPIMLADRKEGQCWVEPFVGGANMIDKVDGLRIGSDTNNYLVALLLEMQKENFVAPIIDKCLFEKVKANKEEYEPWLVGFVAFQLSYGAMWFGSYRRDSVGRRDYALEAKRNVEKQAPNVYGVKFYNAPYNKLVVPPCSLIYCDPPYKGTAEYKGVLPFNHSAFWQWCREKKAEGHTVFISEYNAPADFSCVWKKEIQSGLNTNSTKKGVEKLFTI